MIRGLKFTTKGGPGSGNIGHAGRPGSVGGSAPSKGGTLAVGENELYRWANLAEAVDISWKPSKRDPETPYSLDVTDKQDFYFAPHSVLSERSWVKNTYGRFILDKKTLEEGGWSKDPNLRAEGAWRWKPGNLGGTWRDYDAGFQGRVYARAIRGFEITSIPGGYTKEDVRNILTYRYGRTIPVIETSVSEVTLS